MKHFHFVAVAAAVAFTFAQSAGAQDAVGSKYWGASIGSSEVDDHCDGIATCDSEDTGLAVYGGYNFHENFAAEYGFAYLGEAIRTTRAQTTSGDLTPTFTQRSDGGRYSASALAKLMSTKKSVSSGRPVFTTGTSSRLSPAVADPMWLRTTALACSTASAVK